MTIQTIIVGLIAGMVSAALSRRRYERQLKAQRDEFRRLLLAEYAYWRDQPDGDADQAAIHIGAMGAVSNVLAATDGHPAPWHAKPQERKGAR